MSVYSWIEGMYINEGFFEKILLNLCMKDEYSLIWKGGRGRVFF